MTAVYLRPIAGALATVREKHPDLRLRLIGAGDAARNILSFAEILPWSGATESQLLADCDVGLMPLPDDDFTRAKCGLKLIQYMAAGLPVVGSPVGANCDIISEGRDGYFAGDSQQWISALDRLIASSDLRREFGRNGAQKAAREYSRQTGFAAWMQIIDPHFHNERDRAPNAVTVVGS